ncbi:MAG: hypothetical protein JNK15_13200, partial [Planctomycetes bacterium]|nr:hypothetical protein [Planctomycetota bacterium]
MHPNARRPLASFLAAIALAAALQAQTPIGFEETYALSADRAAAVATLIPGSPDWYYWHCRERLDARDFATVRRLLPQWVQRHGSDARSNEIECREMLLSADGDRERTFLWLKDRLGLGFDHQPQIPGAATTLPTRLDPQLVAQATLTARAFANHPGTVQGFTDLAIRGLADTNLDADQLHDLLGRLRFSDVDNLPALVVRDLDHRVSGGFGSLAIHAALRLDQLEECARLRPDLLRDGNFVNAWLMQATPTDPFWQHDPAQRAAHLQRLWTFAQRLPPAFRSLQAQVLHQWLQHELTQGGPDKQRFLAYLRLPRPTGHAPFRERRGEDAIADLGQAFPTALPPCGDDGELVRACLEHFFATEANADAYTEWLDAEWVRGVLAETKLLRGDGDPERWYGLLADPARVERLKDRVEIRFAPTTTRHFRAGDAVTLPLDVKNVPTLLVKVYDVDAARYLQETGREVDAGIPLDGVMPNFEQTHTYGEPPLRRVRRTFELPMLAEAGTWVVEFVGNGVRSRAVVQKGQLRMAERSSAAGHLVRVFDEAGDPVPDATAWFGGRDYTADARGEILLPFSTAPGQKPVVLRRGRLASLAQLEHRAETFALDCHAHVDREALVAGQTAKILVRPSLALDGRPVALAMLQDVVLTIVATDLDGRSTTAEVRDPAFVDDREFVHDLAVAERLVSLTVSLQAKVKDLAGNDVALATEQVPFHFNGMDAGVATSSFQLLPTRTGHVLEARGKNGERRAGRVAHVQLRHRDFAEPIDVTLQTDGEGRIELGALDGITSILASDGQHAAEFDPARATATWPQTLHGLAGDTLRLPWTGAAPTRRDLSLLGKNDHFANVAVRDGMLEMRDLQAGSYRLHDHTTGRAVRIEVLAGRRHGEWLADAHWLRSASRSTPLTIGAAFVRGERLVVQLGNARGSTRVHVVAGRAVSPFDPFAHLAAGRAVASAFGSMPTSVALVAERALGDEYRYVLERRHAGKYAGNMLARPSLLLNPWQLDSSDTTAVWGEPGEGMPGSPNPVNLLSARQEALAKKQVGGASGTAANLDWMPHGSRVLANLVPNAAGTVEVPLADLGDGQFVQVLALDGDEAVQTALVRAEQPVTPRARTLQQALDGTKALVEQKRIEFVAAGATTLIPDARSAQVEVHDSLASVFRLFTTISQNQDLAQFAFVLDWPNKKPEEKAVLYREHACHELHFFLAKKDPQFFAAVVRPFLQQKLDKTFLDHWLLGDDLTAFTEPWAFAQLNLVERILLAQRLDGAGRTAVARTVSEALELRPSDVDRLSLLFDQALDASRLDTTRFRGLSAGLEHYGKAPTRRSEAPDPAKNDDQHGGVDKERKAAAEPRQDGKLERDRNLPADAPDAGGVAIGANLAEELDRRHEARPLYRAVAKTKLLVEHNWFHRTMQASTADVVTPNRFWADYATAPAGQPFVSSALVEATGSCLEMMLALAVLDLPFTPGKHEITADGDARTLKAATPLLLVRKEVTPAERAEGGAPMLLGQNFFRLDDRFETVNGERRDRFVTGEFVVDVPYGCQVVVTNPTSTPRTA